MYKVKDVFKHLHTVGTLFLRQHLYDCPGSRLAPPRNHIFVASTISAERVAGIMIFVERFL